MFHHSRQKPQQTSRCKHAAAHLHINIQSAHTFKNVHKLRLILPHWHWTWTEPELSVVRKLPRVMLWYFLTHSIFILFHGGNGSWITLPLGTFLIPAYQSLSNGELGYILRGCSLRRFQRDGSCEFLRWIMLKSFTESQIYGGKKKSANNSQSCFFSAVTQLKESAVCRGASWCWKARGRGLTAWTFLFLELRPVMSGGWSRRRHQLGGHVLLLLLW